MSYIAGCEQGDAPVKKTTIVIAACMPGSRRRAAELFVDGRFKPRVVKSKRAYSRKTRDNRKLDQ